MRAHCPKFSKISNLYLQNSRHNIEKTAGTGCTFIIHLEIHHNAVLNMKNFNILTANINNCMNIME